MSRRWIYALLAACGLALALVLALGRSAATPGGAQVDAAGERAQAGRTTSAESEDAGSRAQARRQRAQARAQALLDASRRDDHEGATERGGVGDGVRGDEADDEVGRERAGGDDEDDELDWSPPEPEVALLEAGGGAGGSRAPVRYAPQEGEAQTLVIDMRVTLRGGPLSLKLPRTRTTMRITMGGEAEGGARHGEVELLDALVLEEPGQIATAARALRQQLPRLKGARGYLLIDARGVVREAEVELPDALAGEEASRELRGTIEGLRETLSQLTVPLPDEPIGEGARWSVSAPRSRKDGISLLHTAICQLRSRRGDELELAFEVVQSAEPQPITAPAELAGARVELVSYAAEGTGRMRLELDELFPQWVEMALKSELELRAQGGGPSLTIGLDIELQATRPDGE